MSTESPGALPEGLDAVFETTDATGAHTRIGVRRARAGELVDAYPAGTHDRELLFQGRPQPAELARVTAEVLASDPRCRRVVIALPELDLDAIAWAEEGGFRYVVDVETRSGGFSLLVTEPDWVLAQPHILDEIPLKE